MYKRLKKFVSYATSFVGFVMISAIVICCTPQQQAGPNEETTATSIIIGNPEVRLLPSPIIDDFTYLVSDKVYSLLLQIQKSVDSSPKITEDNKKLFKDIASKENTKFLSESIEELNKINKKVEDALNLSGITTASTEPQFATFGNETLEEPGQTEIEILLDSTDSNFIRLYFKNLSENVYPRFYLFNSNDNQEVTQALYFSFNPDHDPERDDPTTIPASKNRVFAFSIDYSDPQNAVLIFLFDRYDENLNYYTLYNFQFSCNITNSDEPECLWEKWMIKSPPPTREVSNDLGRIWWSLPNEEFCRGFFDLSIEPYAISDTAGYSLADGFLPDCILPTPPWSLYDSSRLFVREEDTPLEPTGTTYYKRDSKEGYEQLTPSVIFKWLGTEK